jgi:hypothetical protein
MFRRDGKDSGPLAELADALDSKSIEGAVKPLEKQTSDEKNPDACAALAQRADGDADLMIVCAAWGKLAPAVRAGILAMVRSVQ